MFYLKGQPFGAIRQNWLLTILTIDMNIIVYKSHIKALSQKNLFLNRIIKIVTNLYARRGVKISKSPGVSIKVFNLGVGNSFKTGTNCYTDKMRLEFRGNNNMVILGDNVSMKEKCRIMITGNNCSIKVGSNSTFSHHCQLEAQEEATHIIIGEDCMFSNNILVRTNDSHYIYDAETGDRTNIPGDVHIGDHVWLAAYTTVMKGATIGDGTVVGYRSVVTKNIPAKCVAVGMPAKVIREKIEWSREPKSNKK